MPKSHHPHVKQKVEHQSDSKRLPATSSSSFSKVFCLPQLTFLPHCWKADFDVATIFLEIKKTNTNIPAFLVAEHLPAEGKKQMIFLFCFATFTVPVNVVFISIYLFLSLQHRKKGIRKAAHLHLLVLLHLCWLPKQLTHLRKSVASLLQKLGGQTSTGLNSCSIAPCRQSVLSTAKTSL